MPKKKIPPKKNSKKVKEFPKENLTGTLRLHARGFGFVVPDHPMQSPQDIFIPKHLTDGGVDGDHVEVEVSEHVSEKGPEGKIVSILKRGRTHIGGTVLMVDHKGVVFVHCPLLGASKPVVATSKNKLKVGDRVILKVEDWGGDEKLGKGEVSRYLGHISDPKVDIPATIEEFDLLSDFSTLALDQAKKWGTEVSQNDLKGRVDFTKTPTITIDPETAKDFDDALSLSKDKKGIFHLVVHIADVAHYVKPGSPLDLEAFERANSTYFPGFCLPMLPSTLSDNLCSLQPDVVRLTVSLIMDFDAEGNLLSSKICRGYIKSAKRFSYEEAKEALDGKIKSPFTPLLEEMVSLCRLLKKKRSERGSIDFALPEMVIVIDKNGEPTGTKVVQYDITHQLVEEFMLKANEIVAKHFHSKNQEAIFRIHEEPAEDNMEDFFALARTLGFSLPANPTQKDLQELFEKAKSSPHGQQLSVGFIRSMKLAYYSKENVGHYGLALEHYCHFTSPIRRYSDLIIERLLFDECKEDTDLEMISQHCSDQERVSFKAEMSIKGLKKYRLLKKWMEEKPSAIYDAVVTKVKPFGIYFELPALMLEGFLHISELENDYFVFNPQLSVLVGKSSGKTHRSGEPIQVKPLMLDLILLEAKWEIVAARRKK